MKICFIDIETTGLDWNKEKIWQLAGCIRDNGKIKQKFNIINKKSEKAIYYNFKKILNKHIDPFNPKDKMYFLAYNAGFDSSFIRRMFDSNNDKFFGSYFINPYICLMQMAARYFMKNQKKVKPNNFKLSTICKYFKIPINEKKLHDGNYDIEISRKLYNKLDKLV